MTNPVKSDAIKGAVWMLFASLFYVSSATLTRYLDGSYDTFQLAFLRCVVAVCVLTPVVLRGGLSQLKTRIIHIHGLRMVTTYIAILFWFYAAETVPVGDFFAIQFASPLFTIGAAALLLRENVTLKSWLAAIVGFGGVLIIVRPGYIPMSIGIMAAIATALSYALVNTLIKVASRHDSPTVMTFYVNFLIVPVSAIPAYFVWKTPLWADVPTLLGVTLFATLAQFCVANAISLADARVVQPMNFMRMPLAALFGFLMFSEFPDLWTWIGAVIIFAAAWYAVQHGAATRKKATA
ncbi:MAG: DMT family transporter [Proteobacteria bacterium]|nr:DMT family transporter [Pseudomonadota bacterium]